MIGMFSGLTLTYTFGENHVTVQTKTMNLLENIDTKNLPKHLAIIMDGNGRWAKQQATQALGHESGTKSKIIIKTCAKLAIENLTLCLFNRELEPT
jgi:undecaprenyl diphosphate synthase